MAHSLRSEKKIPEESINDVVSNDEDSIGKMKIKT